MQIRVDFLRIHIVRSIVGMQHTALLSNCSLILFAATLNVASQHYFPSHFRRERASSCLPFGLVRLLLLLQFLARTRHRRNRPALARPSVRPLFVARVRSLARSFVRRLLFAAAIRSRASRSDGHTDVFPPQREGQVLAKV